MDKKSFEAIEPTVDEIAEVARDLLESPAVEELTSLLTKLGKQLGNRYEVGFHVSVSIFDTEMQRRLSLFNTGLAGFDEEKPFLIGGDSSMQRYIVKGETFVVPRDRCPLCWGTWDAKILNPTCPNCGVALGSNVKIRLDSEDCPNCEEGNVTTSEPRCDKCGYEVDLTIVSWDEP